MRRFLFRNWKVHIQFRPGSHKKEPRRRFFFCGCPWRLGRNDVRWGERRRKPRAPNFAAQPQALSGAAVNSSSLNKEVAKISFLLCMRLKRALMKRGAKIIFYGCFFANYQKNRVWTAGYGDRHERGIKGNSKPKGSPAEIQTFGRTSFCPELSVGNKSDGSILKEKVDYCVFLK